VTLRILFLADTHLGFDLATRPRVQRRRRGHDFFAMFERVLREAIQQDYDFLVHGGDVFYRSRVPASLVQRAFMPLKRVAEAGIPVLVVPGNHERSAIPHASLALHPGIHVFDRPRTFVLRKNDCTVAFSGFPYCRRDVRQRFPQLLSDTEWRQHPADVHLLCVHHCFEGATVGPADFTFRFASDVVRLSDIPDAFSAVLTGHVHRHQVLDRDLRGKPLSTPVMYPGSIERTSFAERDEPKGYLSLEEELDAAGGRLTWEFRELPTRPMVIRDLHVAGMSFAAVDAAVRGVLAETPDDAVLRVRVHAKSGVAIPPSLSVPHLRAIAPATMNVEVRYVDEATGSSLWNAERTD